MSIIPFRQPSVSPAQVLLRRLLALWRALTHGDLRGFEIATRELGEIGIDFEVDARFWGVCDTVADAGRVDLASSARTRGAATTPPPASQAQFGRIEGSSSRSDLGDTPSDER